MPRYEMLVNSFLQGALVNMQARDFHLPPVEYVAPQVYLQKDRVGAVSSVRFFLTLSLIHI